jgi:hypothetical protein
LLPREKTRSAMSSTADRILRENSLSHVRACSPTNDSCPTSASQIQRRFIVTRRAHPMPNHVSGPMAWPKTRTGQEARTADVGRDMRASAVRLRAPAGRACPSPGDLGIAMRASPGRPRQRLARIGLTGLPSARRASAGPACHAGRRPRQRPARTGRAGMRCGQANPAAPGAHGRGGRDLQAGDLGSASSAWAVWTCPAPWRRRDGAPRASPRR